MLLKEQEKLLLVVDIAKKIRRTRIRRSYFESCLSWRKILIEKVDWVKTSEQLPIEVKYTNPRIYFYGKYWYIYVGMEQEKY